MDVLALRSATLAAHQASESERQELLAYNQNVFDHSQIKKCNRFPLEAEPHLAVWKEYAAEAERIGVYDALKPRLVQFQFPILAGISQTADYRAATRQGKSTPGLAAAKGLELKEPDKLQLRIHPTLAGPIPAIVAGNRQDFVALVQALTERNEPQPVPDSMGACMVGGYNNWDRVRRYRQQWSASHPERCSDSDWTEEFQRLVLRKELYQDRFILLSPGPYSNVPASELGLTEGQWRPLSLTVRLEHESTHYVTRRLLGSMRNNLLDETIADYRGIVAAIGCYRADWFLRFMGLENFPAYRQGGRLENYRGDPPLSEGAFKILQALVKTAAENLEAFDRKFSEQLRNSLGEAATLIALTTSTLEELASPGALAGLEAAVRREREGLLESGIRLGERVEIN